MNEWCEHCYLRDEKPCAECGICFPGHRNFRKTLRAQLPTTTNADRIRAMSDDELDQFIRGVFDMGQAQTTIRKLGNTTDMFEWGLDWLQRPAMEAHYE